MKKLKILFPLLAVMALCSCSNNTSSSSLSPSSSSSANSSNTSTSSVLNGYFEREDEEGNLYKGNFVNGEYDGYGVMEYITGTIYEGTWSEGKWEGSCKITWDSGCVYIGEAHDGAMHGIGYMIWPMGDYYYGDWRNGSPNGAGTKYYMVDSTAEDVQHQYNIYTGDMKNNLKVGKGVMRYSFGAMYDGDWENDVRQGYGTVYWEPGTEFLKFEGEFKNDWIDGQGTMYYSDGRIVKGTFKGVELVSGNYFEESLKAFVNREAKTDLSSSTLMLGASYFSFWTTVKEDIGGDINPINFGLGGSTAKFWSTNIDTLDGLTSSPLRVFIRMGGNDFADSSVTVEETTGYVKNVIDSVMTKFPTADVCYIPLVTCPSKMNDGRKEKQQALNKAIKEYVAEKASDKLKYFETEDFVYLPKGETSAYYDANKDLYLNESLYRDDNLHLNREGYRLLGQAISACL